jgi:hypothetical protein
MFLPSSCLDALVSSIAVAGLVLGGRDTSVLEKLGLDRTRGRIRCPRCEWTPQRTDRWLCDPGCGEMWNTFETRGCCPGCSKQWAATVCLRCREWSPHDAWYEHEPE